MLRTATMRAPFLPLCCLIAGLLAPRAAHAQAARASEPATAAPAPGAEIDGIAARIEEDVVTESEVRELGAFQDLVDGRARSRAEILTELTNQWIVRSEAAANQFPRPSVEDVERGLQELAARFGSDKDFQGRCQGLGLGVPAIRRLLGEQLYLSRYLDFKFRPAAQVDRAQIEDYYRTKLAPELKAKGAALPPIEDVAGQIRELLTEQAISERAGRWLDDARERLRVKVFGSGKP